MTAACTSSILLFALFICCRSESNYSYKYYDVFHVGPLISPETKVGWMNDPNGFCFFKGEYHLFYQYNPLSSLEPGIAHWGHAKSKDLINWVHMPIALYPDKWFDMNGVFSGSALVENDTMYIYYTGNVNHPDQTPDHEQHQILATSTDGETFVKLENNPIINGTDRQPNFRDPKVWKHCDKYYMVLGNSIESDNVTIGQALLYGSEDKFNWKELVVLDKSDGSLGYMWECPDFFELDGRFVLLFSPQGLKSQGDKFKNLFSTGYKVGSFDYINHMYTEISPFIELDHGHDFYATQTILNEIGERIVIAWFDMWEQNYPEGPDGFTGQMTLPRTLKLDSDGRLLQQPVKEIEQAVGMTLYSGRARSGTKVKLNNNVGKIEVRACSEENFKLMIECECGNGTVTISYDYKDGLVTLDRGGHDGVRRTKYRPKNNELRIDIYMDRSSIEVFYGLGEVTFSSRIFFDCSLIVCVAEGSYANELNVFDMKRTVSNPSP